MECKNWNCWKDAIDLVLKAVFVAVFTWGVCSAVCCMSSCCDSKSSGCSTTETADVKPCGSKK